MIEFLDIVGRISTAIVIIGAVWAFILWTRGILPAVYRLGNGLAKRKIAIFAKGDNLNSLQSMLIDSGLFSKNNICAISKKEDIGSCEKATLFLMYWHDFAVDIDDILRKKRDNCPLIVYSPKNQAPIPQDQVEKIDGHRNTALSNFRGRLLNDIVTSLITTSYEKN